MLGIEGNYVSVSDLYLGTLLENPVSFVMEVIKKVLKTFIYLGFRKNTTFLWGFS